MSITSTVQDLSEENEKLRKRLEKCKADKNFVWTLWKQLQLDNPDMTRVVDLIVTREKEKAAQKEIQVGTLLAAKGRKLEELKETLSMKDTALREVTEQWQTSQQVLAEREKELSQAAEALTAAEEEKAVVQERCKEDTLSVVEDLQSQLAEREREKGEMAEVCRVQLEESERGRREAEERLHQKSARLEEVQALLAGLEEAARESSQCNVKCKNLDADLQVKTEQLRKTSESLKKRNKEVKRLREALSSVQGSMASMVSHSSVQAAGMQQLQERLGQVQAVDAGREERIRYLEAELARREGEVQRSSAFYQGQVAEFELQIQHLQEDIARFQSSPPSRSSPTLSSTRPPSHIAASLSTAVLAAGGGGGRGGGGESTRLKKHLEAAESELFELKRVLQAKEEEMAELKGAHERRLERMRTLQAEHKLVLQQLQTFEQNGSTSPPPRGAPPLLQQEDSSAVWNQLHAYKRECEQLRRTNISLSEECDSLRASVVQHKTTSQERTGRGGVQGHEELLQKFALIADLELDAVTDSSEIVHGKRPSAPTPSHAPSYAPSSSQSGKLVLRLQRERTQLQKQLRESQLARDSLQTHLDSAKQDLLQERRRRAMRERALSSSGKTFADASTNTTTKIVQSHDQSHDLSHDLSHGRVGTKHFSAVAVQTEGVQASSGCVRSMTTQTASSSRDAGVQTNALIADIRTHNQAESVSVCMQTKDVSSCSSVEELRLGGSQTSLQGRKRRGGGKYHKRSLSEGTALVQKRREGEQGGPSLEGSRDVPCSSQSASGLSQRPPAHCSVCQQKRGAEEREEAGTVSRVRVEAKALKERTRDLEKQLSRCVAEKQAVTHSLGVEKVAHIKTLEETKDLRGQLGRCRAESESLFKEVAQLREQCSQQRARCEEAEQLRGREAREGAERIARLTADKKKLEERLKLHAQKLESMSQTVKTTDSAALQKTAECKELESRVSRLERDVKQKRQLIESLKEKESSQQQLMEECRGKMDTLLAEIHSLSSSNEQYRQRSQSLRKQLSEERRSKDQVSGEMDKCKQELHFTLQGLSRCQAELKDKAAASSQHLVRLQEAEDQLQEALHQLGTLNSEGDHLRRVLEEHQTFTVSLLSEIHLCLMAQQRRGVTKAKDHSIRGRARHIARNALNLSDNELDEFLEEASGAPGRKEVSLVKDHLRALWESSKQHCVGGGDKELSALMLELFNPLLQQLATPYV